MSTGLACLVHAIEVDSSRNAITLADFVPPGVKGNRSYLPAPPPPKTEEDSNDRKNTTMDFCTPRRYWKCLLHLIL